MLSLFLSHCPIKKEMTLILHDPFFPFLGKPGCFLFPHPNIHKSSFKYSSGSLHRIGVNHPDPYKVPNLLSPSFFLLQTETTLFVETSDDSPFLLQLFRNSKVVQHCHFSHTLISHICAPTHTDKSVYLCHTHMTDEFYWKMKISHFRNSDDWALWESAGEEGRDLSYLISGINIPALSLP